MLAYFREKLSRRGQRRVISEGILLCLLFVALRYFFNLVLLPQVFPAATPPMLQEAALDTAPALLLALAYWLGLSYFSLFTLAGLLLSRSIGLHFLVLEGATFPSLMANVLTTASQGGGLLIGGLSEYALWCYRRFRQLKASAPPASGGADDELISK